MPLLERDAELAALRGHFMNAAAGHGRIVFLGGEAGCGKTSLVSEFLHSVSSEATVTIVSCDGHALPSPFGGFAHLGSALGPDVDEMIAEQLPRDQIFRSIFDALRTAPTPNVIVGEDAHWTDQATIDLIRYLGRRVGQTRSLFIVTYRDDALDRYHPLRRVLGDLVSEPATARMSVAPFSPEAVGRLAAGTGIDPIALHERTDGNPFYVTEILGAAGATIPETIFDAVLARASRLSLDGRAMLDVAAVLGALIDTDLLEQMIGAPADDSIDEALAAGILRVSDRGVTFRHALGRDVLYEALSPTRRRSLHRRALAVLLESPGHLEDAALLAHHADGARDREAVLRYGPLAAEQAARFGAHREAAAQLARTLRYAEDLPGEELAALLETRSYECYVTALLDEAIADCERAIELRRDEMDMLKVGDNLRALSRYLWFSGQVPLATERANQALEILESLPPGPELAMAYSNLSQLRMLSHDRDDAIHWGEKAIALARELDDQRILAHALTNVGSAVSYADFEQGRVVIEEAVRVARACNLHDDIVRGLTNLAWTSMEHFELSDAERYTDESLEFTIEHDIVGMELYLRGIRARLLLARAAWSAAEAEANVVLYRPGHITSSLIVANTVLGIVRARRGDDPTEPLDEALRLAQRTGELQRLGPVRAARAEAAWLAGDPERAAAEAAHELSNARRAGEPWIAGALALWMHRGGAAISDLTNLAPPFADEISGDFEAAARFWRDRDMPIEEARALASSGDESNMRSAHATFDRFGARPDAALAVNALREAGASRIPRGPRTETRSNAAGLTSREQDVLALLVQGQTNKEIAERLYLSPRTVGHHVSAILAKLEIESREEAAARSAALGLI